MFNSQQIAQDAYVATDGQQVVLKSKVSGLGEDLEMANGVPSIIESSFDSSMDGKVEKLANVTVDLGPFNLKEATYSDITEAGDEVSFTLTVTNQKEEEIGSCEVSGKLQSNPYAQPGERTLVITGATGTYKVGEKAGAIGQAAAAA